MSPIVVGHAVTVIIVVCVGFLVFMIVLGVIRIRAAHHRTIGSNHRGGNPSDEDQELAWDDTALTITVNPLDQLDGTDAETTLNNHSHDQVDCDDDSDTSSNESYHEDDSSDEDGIMMTESNQRTASASISNGKNKDNLVWDDSALGY